MSARKVSAANYTYASVEMQSLHAVAVVRGVKKLDGQTEGRTKHVHALVLQSINRHGKNVPPRVAYAEVRRAIVRSGRYGNPLIIALIPLLIQFLKPLFDIVLAQITDWLNSLANEEQPVALATLAAPARVKFSLDA